jgi:hypothetical protein
MHTYVSIYVIMSLVQFLFFFVQLSLVLLR